MKRHRMWEPVLVLALLALAAWCGSGPLRGMP